MRINLLKSILLFTIIPVLFFSCEEDNEKESLYVKFINSSDSDYTITSIQLLHMGEAGVQEEPVGEFGDNILEAGETIIPGGHKFFTLDIPSLHYAYYRLTVDDGAGNQILLHDQVGYIKSFDGTITHWGGDDRTVEVQVVWDEYDEIINVQMWSDWVGID